MEIKFDKSWFGEADTGNVDLGDVFENMTMAQDIFRMFKGKTQGEFLAVIATTFKMVFDEDAVKAAKALAKTMEFVRKQNKK